MIAGAHRCSPGSPGFGRTLVFTNTVGAGSTGDIYLAANTVPNIVFEVVAGGALASLVVPMLAGGIAPATGSRSAAPPRRCSAGRC